MTYPLVNEMNEPDSYEPPLTLTDAQLAVVAAAKEQRRLDLAIDNVKRTGPAFNAAMATWSAACRALAEATDRLLALEAGQG